MLSGIIPRKKDFLRLRVDKYVRVTGCWNHHQKDGKPDKMNRDSQATIPLRKHVQTTVNRYLEDMGNTEPENLYQMLLSEIEPPLIEAVLKKTAGNQSRAAVILGITRNTLRTKMQRYAIQARPRKITRLRR
jgi:Fis family transcriptional regulator